MLVLGVNKVLNWCQVLSNGRKYTCPTKIVDGELCFAFKKGWHSVGKYISEHAEELVAEGGKTFLRPYKQEE